MPPGWSPWPTGQIRSSAPANTFICPPLNGDDAELALCYLLYAQYYAFHTALVLGITPTILPERAGQPGRAGVNIYPFNQQGGV